VTEQQIRRLANNQLAALVAREPTNTVARAVYQRRLEAYRVPTFTQSSGKEGWYE